MPTNDRSGAAQGESRTINEDSIRRHLIEQVARRSRITAAEIDPDRPLEEFGLASRDAVAIAGELEQMLGRALPATLVWEHPTINRLSVALAGAAGAGAGAGTQGGPGSATGAPDTASGGFSGGAAGRPYDEPIAVVGIGCRFPGGVDGPESFWSLLEAGGDAIGEVPDGRWDAYDDGSPEIADLLARTTRRGGFLDDIAGFDAQFFGITPREAAVMDPQQRLVLEVAWEAFEHAGLAPASLRGSRTGVFVGVSAPEYAGITASDLSRLEAWTATGAALSIIANRLSYLLDLRGPSMIVDTACSSSLVSTHLAVQSLRSGESDVALAGGVNLLLSPTITMTFDQAGGTASDGHCKAFDASADGMVRAEGCGAVVLKRLSDAQRDGDRVLALIKGSGVNSDGRSNGLVAPNSDAQKALLRDVYANAGIDPHQVDYVEAHGTGTFLGDPIEARAMGEVLGVGREPDEPLFIGSAKSNLGHMEAAAGIAGLIKTVLALAHRTIPRSIHYTQPNPHIPFDELCLQVAAEQIPWPRRGHPARAGVSGFGFGGTNAHVLLEEAEQAPHHAAPVIPARPYLLSDVAADRIADGAARLAGWLAEHTTGPAPLADIAGTLDRRLGRGRARAAVVARDRAGLIDGLTALAEGRPDPAVVTGTALGMPGQPVWVFSGYGAQRPGMGQKLLAEEAAFAEAIDDLDALFAEEAGFSLWDVLERGEETKDPAMTMPVLFGMQIGLARMLNAYGVRPGAVVGHSMGEVAAAVVAGALSLEDGVKVITRRSKLMMRLVGGGAMAVLGASADEVRALAHDCPDVHAAVHSSPRQTVVTGDADQIATVVARAEAEGRLARMVKAEGAGHSPQVDPLLPELRAELAELTGEPVPAAGGADGVRMYTTALDDPRALFADGDAQGGTDADGDAANRSRPVLDADYWAANLRNPVRLTDAVSAAAEDGYRTFIEVNAHPILSHAVGETLEADGVGGALIVHTLKRAPKGQDTDDTVTFHTQLATLAVNGLAVRFPAGGHVVDLPRQPWRHDRHWMEPSRRTGGRDEHPLLGAHVELPGEDRHAWRADVGTGAQPWLTDLRVHGVNLLPAAAFAEMALAAGAEVLGTDAVRVTALWLERLLPLGERTTVTTTFSLADQRVEVHAQNAAGTWTRLASADVAADRRPAPSSGAGTMTVIEPAERGSRHYRLHPEVFDRCLSALTAEAATTAEPGAAEGTAAGAGIVWLPESIGGLAVHGPTHRGGRCQVRVVHGRDGTTGELQLIGTDGELLVEATGIALRRVDRAEVPVPLADKLVEVAWSETAIPEPSIEAGTESGGFVIIADPDDAMGAALGDSLESLGHQVIRPDVALFDDLATATATAASITAATTTVADSGAGPGSGTFGDLVDRLGAVAAAAGPLAGVVVLPPADLVDEQLVLTVADLARSLVTAAAGPACAGRPPRLWLATRGVLPVRPGEAGEPRQGFVRALVRVLGFEHAPLRATLVDVDRAIDGATALTTELLADARDTEVAWRAGLRYAARIEPVEATAGAGPDGAAAALRPRPRRIVRRDGAYIITGGYGGIGLVTAQLLAERGAGRIVLSGRSGPPPEAEKIINRLRETGVHVGVVLGDIAQPGVAERLVAVAHEGGTRLRGVVHGAAGMDDRLIADLGAEDLHRVWTAKVVGAWRLHEATAALDLDWFVMHSSAAALLGSPGQASYAAANAAIDALVSWRRAQGLPGTTINWGTWSQVGGFAQRTASATSTADTAVTADVTAGAEAGATAGPADPPAVAPAAAGPAAATAATTAVLEPISPQEGAEALEALLANDRVATGVLRFDPATAVALFPEIREMPYFTALAGAADALGTGGADDGDWPGAEALREMEPETARRMMADRVRSRVAAVLGFDLARLDPATPLTDLGLDSLVAVRIKSAIEHDLGLTVPAAILLQGASIEAFEDWAAGELGLGEVSVERPAPAHDGRPIVLPRDAAERLVARIFEEVLDLRPVGVTDDFFELGGQEHQADLVVAHLAAELGGDLNRTELFAVPTAEHVADVIRIQEEEAARQTVRALRPAGAGAAPAGGAETAPIFLAHPAGGSTGCYQQLVNLLGSEHQVFGLERFEDAPSVEERCARYVEHLIKARPDGPFRLGGWSFGGVLAYETARQLQAAGREVDLVALFDAGLPLPVEDEADTLARRFSAFTDYLTRTYDLEISLTYAELAGLTEEAQFALVMERAAPLIELLPPAVLNHQLTSHQDTRSLEAYRPGTYDGHVVLYKAPEETPWSVQDDRYVLDEANGFGELSSNLEIVVIPGAHHLNLLDPPAVDVIAAHLGDRLAAGQGQGRGH